LHYFKDETVLHLYLSVKDCNEPMINEIQRDAVDILFGMARGQRRGGGRTARSRPGALPASPPARADQVHPGHPCGEVSTGTKTTHNHHTSVSIPSTQSRHPTHFSRSGGRATPAQTPDSYPQGTCPPHPHSRFYSAHLRAFACAPYGKSHKETGIQINPPFHAKP